MKKQAMILWISSVLLVSYLSLMSTGGVEAQASREPEWSYQTGGGVSTVDISSDGSYIVAGSIDKRVYFFNRSSSTPVWSSLQTGEDINSVAISADGEYIAVGSDKVYLFNRYSGTPLWSYSGQGSVNHISITSDGSYIAAQDGAKIYLFNRSSSTPIWSSGHLTSMFFSSVAISANGQYIVAGDWEGYVYLFSRADNMPLWIHHTISDVWAVAISSDGSYIAVGGEDRVYLFSSSSSWPLWSYSTANTIRAVNISLDGNYIAAGGYGEKVYLFSRTSSTPLWSYNVGIVSDLSLSSSGEYLAVPGGFKVYLFGRESSTPLWSYNTGHWALQTSITSDGSYIVAGSGNYKVYLFSRNTSPTLTSGSVSPTSGTTDTTFTYEVTYTDADDDAPPYVRVYIDGSSHTMIKVSGTYTGGALYRYTTSSPSTSPHTYYFTASDGIDTARLPTSGSYSGPTVTEQHSTTLSISLSSFTIPIGGSKTLTATLESVPTYIIGFSDVGATSNPEYPIANKTITWSATAGSFSASSTTTNSSGQASVTYYAPSYATTATITASFAGNSQWEVSNDTATATIQFQVTLTFTKPDGSPLANTTIYYGTSKGQETSYLGVTDSQGKITSTNSALAGGTIYFKSPDGAYSGSTHVGLSGGSSNIWLTETSGTPIAESPWAIVAVILIVGGVAGMLVLKKVFFKPKSVKHIMKVKPPKPVPIKLAKTAKRVLNVKSSKLAQTKPAGPFCLHCKLKLPADAAFCPKCGRKVKR